jgi:hypothetical protein
VPNKITIIQYYKGTKGMILTEEMFFGLEDNGAHKS